MWAIKLTEIDRATGKVRSEDVLASRYPTEQACQAMANEMAPVMSRSSKLFRYEAEPVPVFES